MADGAGPIPPPPWTITTAARLRDGRYQPDSSSPSDDGNVTGRYEPLGGSPIGSRCLCVTTTATLTG